MEVIDPKKSSTTTRILLECGNTLLSGGNTGIQRVTRNLAKGVASLPDASEIESHPRIGKQLIWLSNASDTDLLYCYKHSKALLFPSQAEGFGLPLVEGLRHGLPVIASDIPVHRAAGGIYCSYVDPRNPDSLAAVIGTAESSGAFPEVKPWSRALLVDWNASARDFIDKCKKAADGAETLAK